MKLTRMPKGLDNQEKAIFYASKVSLISRELELLSDYWQRCTMKANNQIERFGVEMFGATCLKANLVLCEACKNNETVYKEKRKLKAQFSKALFSLRQNRPVSGQLCTKEEPSFTDLNEPTYFGEYEEWN